LGLNPLTRPFDYIELGNPKKLTLYARKDCTEQLRSNRKISLKIVSREKVEDCYVVTAQATLPDGRCDESIGAVAIKGASGEVLANQIMKAETKSKRRVTLSICGLGMLDETELETVGAGFKPATKTAEPQMTTLSDAEIQKKIAALPDKPIEEAEVVQQPIKLEGAQIACPSEEEPAEQVGPSTKAIAELGIAKDKVGAKQFAKALKMHGFEAACDLTDDQEIYTVIKTCVKLYKEGKAKKEPTNESK
jgi:hypothetical protein